ncbi:MAG: succinylglutamate desuccinylase/aspartoacylase family protein [Pseudomonadota bacterium]
MTVKILNYHALEPGTTLAVLGAIHGNERCGPEAMARLIQELDAGHIRLKHGTLLLMPVANPRAYEKNVRYIERNLNRHLYPKKAKHYYEDYLDPIVCGFIDKADVLLDLHSYASQGEAFIFLDGSNPEEADYARSIGVRNFVYGWEQAFGVEHDKESQGTTEYARINNNTLAITLECGNHQDPLNAEIGYRAIIMTLAYFNMLDTECLAAQEHENYKKKFQDEATSQRCVKMKTVYYREEDASLAKPWRHFDFIAQNEAIIYNGNDAILAPEDGYIILPKIDAKIGEEWLYFGASTPFPLSHYPIS